MLIGIPLSIFAQEKPKPKVDYEYAKYLDDGINSAKKHSLTLATTSLMAGYLNPRFTGQLTPRFMVEGSLGVKVFQGVNLLEWLDDSGIHTFGLDKSGFSGGLLGSVFLEYDRKFRAFTHRNFYFIGTEYRRESYNAFLYERLNFYAGYGIRRNLGKKMIWEFTPGIFLTHTYFDKEHVTPVGFYFLDFKLGYSL